MISTMIKIQDATTEAVMNDRTMRLALDIYNNKNSMDKEQFASAMFEYSAQLASITATLVMEACFTKSQLNEMIDTIKEMQGLGKEVK